LDLAALPVCVPRQKSVQRTGVEPVWPAREAGDLAGSRTLHESERLAGVEPTCPPWRGGAWTARPQAHLAAEGEGVEPSRAFGLALCSTQVPSPVGLPFRLLAHLLLASRRGVTAFLQSGRPDLN